MLSQADIEEIKKLSRFQGRNISLSTIYINADSPPKKVLDGIHDSIMRLRSVKNPRTKEYQDENSKFIDRTVRKHIVGTGFDRSIIIYAGTVFDKDTPIGRFYSRIILHDMDLGETKIRTGDTFDISPIMRVLSRQEEEDAVCDEHFCDEEIHKMLSRRKEKLFLEEIGFDSIDGAISKGIQLEFVILSDYLRRRLECPNDDCMHIHTLPENLQKPARCIKCGNYFRDGLTLYDKATITLRQKAVKFYILRKTSTYYRIFNEDFFGIIGKRRY